MPRRPDARTLLFEKIRNSPARFVHVVGVPYAVERETGTIRDRVWLTVEAPPFGRLRAALNTTSLLSRQADVDDRIRLGISRSAWVEKPAPLLSEDPGQSYTTFEAALTIGYQLVESDALADLLINSGKRAVRAEVWGDLYAGAELGIRQVHCRRASSAVPADVKNRDGALKLYYADDATSELFLFKFAGQA